MASHPSTAPADPPPDPSTATETAAAGSGAIGNGRPTAPESVCLESNYGVPLAVTLLGPACLALSPLWPGARWLCLGLVLFGGFLLLQARLISLRFSDSALEVWRGGSEIRRFPYSAWLDWRLFWPALPVLFYFREERSIHLLPVLFDAGTLREQLQQRLDRGTATPTP